MVFSPIWIFSVAVYFATFLAIVLIAKFVTKPFDNIEFSFKRVFPFEVPKHLGGFSEPYKILLYLFSAMCFVPAFTLASNYGRFQNVSVLSIVVVCVYGLAGICFVFLNFFEVTHVNAHIKIFVVFLSLTLLGNALTTTNGFMLYKVCLDHGNNMIILPICAGIAGLFALILIFIAFNPNLMNWAKLEKVEGEENKYVRPKKFALAYSEWAIFLLLFLGELCFLFELTIQ